MENASRALYMAAGVLISIMIISMFIYLFRAGGRIGENYERTQNRQQLELFNSKFEYYDKSNNTIIDIINVMNLAIDTNKENEYNSLKTVAIDVKLHTYQTLRVSNTKDLERNYIFKSNTGTEKIYIYDLLDKKIDALRGGTYSMKIDVSNDADDTFSTVSDNMKYKYLFKCTDLQYHENGRVKYMKFELEENVDFP